MFDLEQAISNWRTHMLVAGIKTPVPLDELENHLREDIGQQIQSDISPQQAFENSVQQIGCAGELKTEFNKTRDTKCVRRRKMLRMSYRLFPVISSRRIRQAIGVSVGAGVIAYLFYFFHFSLPRHDYTVGQAIVAVLWNMMLPCGIFIGIDQGIQTAAWKNREKDLLSNQD